MNRSAGSAGDPPPWLDGYPNNLTARKLPADPQRNASAYRPWLVASLAWALGLVAQMGAAMLLGFGGLLAAFVLAMSTETSDHTVVLVIGAAVLVGSMAAGIIVMAWFIRQRGGQRALLASFAATVGSWVVGTGAQPLTLPFLAQVGITAAVSIAVLARLTRPQD